MKNKTFILLRTREYTTLFLYPDINKEMKPPDF